MAGEKTEKATPKRRSDERKKGNIFQSKDLATVLSLISIFYFLQFMMPNILKSMQQLIAQFINQAATMDRLTISDLGPIFIRVVITYVVTAFPLLLFAVMIAVIGTGIQTRFLFTPSLLKFKPSRMNPISGIAKMFSLRSIVELTKSIIKIIALIYIIYTTIQGEFYNIPRLMEMSFPAAISFLGELIMSIVFNITIAFVFIGIFDFAYQWYDYEKNIRMSKQDIKEEYKQMEGDPQIKGKIKERQRAMAQARMMQEVPKADVIIRNPTHFAIAIKYDEKKNRAPIVVAKGMDLVALRIIKIAEENNITVSENRPLARGLYESVDLNHEIPEQFYQAVAEVLAFVYNLKKGLTNK